MYSVLIAALTAINLQPWIYGQPTTSQYEYKIQEFYFCRVVKVKAADELTQLHLQRLIC